MVIGFFIFYGFILITSLVGNIWVLVTCYRNLNRNRFSPMWYVANLASADLLFTFLTPFHAINFSWRWVGGDVICKLHAFLVDTSHNTSITTLMVIAYLRLKAITDPFNSRGDNFSNKEYIKIVLIWCMCLVISPLTFHTCDSLWQWHFFLLGLMIQQQCNKCVCSRILLYYNNFQIKS